MNFIEEIKELSYKKDLEGLNLGLSKSAFSELKNGKRPLKAIDALIISWEKSIYLEGPKVSFQYNKIYTRPELIYFWKNIELLFTTKDKLVSFFNLCGLDSKSQMIKRGRNLSPTIEDAQVMALHLSTSIFLLFSNDLDIECVKNNLNTKFKKKVFIPEKFTNSSGSKMRTFTHLVSYSRDTLEKRLVKEILMRMQISEESVRNYSKNINIYTFESFYLILLKFGVTEKFFLNAGANSVNFKKNKNHFKQLLSPKSVKDVYRECIKVTSTVDKNFDYKVLELSDDHCLLSTEPIMLIENNLVNKGLLSKNVLLFRIGHLIATPKYFDINKGNLDRTSFTYDSKTGKSVIRIIF